MTKGKRLARRLALYLSSIDIPLALSARSYKQWAATLQAQYDALDAGQRKLARTTGRRLIKEATSITKAASVLPTPVFIQTQTGSQSIAPRTRSRKEQFKYISRRWSALTPPCPTCRMGCGFSKRSWPSLEWAEEAWARQHDRDTLRVYQCPSQPGFWHLGHIFRSTASVIPTNEISMPAAQLPALPCETGGHA